MAVAEPNELMQRIARVGASIDPDLSDRDVERLVEGARRRRRRRTIWRVGLSAVGAGVAAAVVAMGPWARQVPVGGATARAPAAAVPLRLSDGSVATPLDDASALVVREDATERVAIDLVRGRGRFEVAPRPERLFSVHAGDVVVTVIGTVFSVERVADRIGVTVSRGKVLVEWGVGSRTLGAGESGWFPPLVVGQTGAAVAPPAFRSAPAPAAPAGKKVKQRIARAASDASEEETARPTPQAAHAPETAESLLAAADAARVQGRAQEGAALLRKIVQEHRSDPRAPLAAFTLGRLLLMELGQPRQAAAAFGDARALAPAGPFAEDALAREVEAWAKAGDSAKARARADDYLRSYPTGRRASAVRTFGGGGE
jgi:transmembrane sensor